LNGKRARENGTLPISIPRKVSEVVAQTWCAARERLCNQTFTGALAVLVDALERAVLDLALVDHGPRVVRGHLKRFLEAPHEDNKSLKKKKKHTHTHTHTHK
jgi:hypothetical protein